MIGLALTMLQSSFHVVNECFAYLLNFKVLLMKIVYNVWICICVKQVEQVVQKVNLQSSVSL